jgi:hypothetical protein
MYKPYKNGSSKLIGDIEVYLPPVGYVDVGDGKLEKRPILFKDKKKADQIWQRPELPDKELLVKYKKNWKQLSAEEKEIQKQDPTYFNQDLEAFREREWDRRLHGTWMMIDGEAVFLTGLHYLYCGWWKADFGYPDFRFVDLEVFYLLQYCEEDPNCLGLTLATLRRFGKTAILGCWMFDLPSRNYNKYGGLQSKTLDDAKKVFDLSLILPWKNLPDFFKPIYDFNNTQKSELRFEAPRKKGKSALLDNAPGEDELQSIINYKNSGLFAYDGYKLHRLGIEEPGKTEEVSVYERHQVVAPCLQVKGQIIGKMFAPTTCEEMTKGGAPYMKLYYDSDFKKKNANGRTKTGLYAHFIPAYKGYMYDKYGRSLEKESREFLENERKALADDPHSLSAFIRKHPFTIQEAFMVDGDRCEFNAMILNEVITKLESPEYSNTTVRGDFIWKDGKKDSDAIWVPNKHNGRWEVSWLPTKADECNKIARSWDYHGNPNHRPLNDEKFAMAYDPFSHGIVVGGHKSNAAAAVFRKFDPWVDDENARDEYGRIKWETHTWCADYLARPNDPEESFEDMIIACVFFGCSLLPENNKIAVVDYFKRRGYSRFIMNRPQATFTKDGQSQDTPGIPSSRPMIDYYTNKLKTYVQNYGHLIRHRRIARSLLEFNSLEPTKYDTSVACGYSLVAAEKQVYKQPAPINIVSVIPTYNNSGTTSELNYN